MNKYLEHFKGQEEFIERLLDIRRRLEKNHQEYLLPFLNPLEQKIVSSIINDSELQVSFFGGNETTEMKRALIQFYNYESDYNIQLIEIQYQSKYYDLKHSDVLGALMNLGIKRNQFGDIIINDSRIFCYVSSTIVEYIKCNLEKIGRAKVKIIDSEENICNDIAYDNKTIIVSSLRLDSICAALTNLSRSKINDIIKQKEVKVNHLIIEDTSYICHNNDMVSIRRYGRFIIDKVITSTKKGNLLVNVKTVK